MRYTSFSKKHYPKLSVSTEARVCLYLKSPFTSDTKRLALLFEKYQHLAKEQV